MRTSILLARKHGESVFTLLAGPEVALHEQREQLAGLLVANKVHDDFAEVQFWESDDGCQRILKFEPTKDFESRQAKIKADHLAYEESQKPKGKKPGAKPEAKKPGAPAKPESEPAEEKADL